MRTESGIAVAADGQHASVGQAVLLRDAPDYFPGNVDDGNWDAYPQSRVLPNSGHVRVTVAPTGVKVDYVLVKLPKDKGTNKTVAYTFNVGGQNNLAVVSAANFANIGAAAECLLSAFGTGLAGANGATTLKVKDSTGTERDAQLLYTAPTQINFIVPPGTAPGKAEITVWYAGNAVASASYAMDTVAPALFTANVTGLGVAAANAVHVRSNGAQVIEPIYRCGTTAGSCVPVPLEFGGVTDELFITLYGTGLRHRAQLSDVAARLGGELVAVEYAGTQPEYFGLDQVNVKVPRTLIGRGEVPLIFSVAGRSITPVTVNIR